MTRGIIEYDVIIVGAGPAGLAAAIRLRQLAASSGREISVCVLEKGAQIGAHILSGAVIDPIALDELLPDWRTLGAPLKTKVCEDEVVWLSAQHALPIPHFSLPPQIDNRGLYVGSLGELCSWLGAQAETLGVELYPGFAAAAPCYNEAGALIGVLSGDMGRNAAGEESARFEPGIEIRGRYTLVAEGAGGSLTRELETRYGLREGIGESHYGLGIKELWRVPAQHHRTGSVAHFLGWPLGREAGGGAFLYQYGEDRIALGLVTHFGYRNPQLSPFDELQCLKTHPCIAALLTGGERLGYGARSINEGGLQSQPRLSFPGGLLLGCAAGLLNVLRIKGTHTAMKSGMLAAEAVAAALQAGRGHDELTDFPAAVATSWIGREQRDTRNVKPLLTRFGTVLGSLFCGVEMWLLALGLRLPWTLRHPAPARSKMAAACNYPPRPQLKPDGVLTFDRNSSLMLANISHEHDQPPHLRRRNTPTQETARVIRFAAPETRYCPGGVYEQEGDAVRITSQNCLHCKACELHDPEHSLLWHPPEGRSGPQYIGM
ncbi:electron transfer flavoprotein-ubiquinone oxidoreductase [Uliginosibacterium gangwonense]|uniref:electron transfer flavoprotein-ubiquinone oxidoreductase n=1 Tax=Uliginosibacterium gangwonense TaxID=392736 RepID=UPI00037A84AA|nr:electron-transfer flavoprotein:ubiquinone oxidoreductase [Uliginosibacterium gangwonense]